jgi:hypothetical protein
MQKLHAFVNIKQLLKQDEAELSGGEAPRTKALRLALANNFVTELTSLVVVAKQEVTIASLENTASSSSSRYSPSLAYSFPTQPRSAGMGRRSYNKKVAHSFPAKSAPTYSGISAHSLSPQSAMSNGWFYSQSNMYSNSNSDIAHGLIPSSRGRNTHPFQGGRMRAGPRTTTTMPPLCSGSISLYSKTYHRGASVSLVEDTEDLGLLRFADKLVSLSVEGDCCWEVFTGIAYSGDSKYFTSSGTFSSTTSVGNLFRNAKSVKKC